MRRNLKNLNRATAILTAFCMLPMGASSIFAKGSSKQEKTTEATSEETTGDEQVIMMEDGQVVQMGDGASISADSLISGTFKPSESTWESADSYEFPFLGLKFKLPEELLKQMDKKEVAMLTDEEWADGWETDEGTWKYAYISWSTMNEEQRNAEVDKVGTGYEDWVASLGKIGCIGVYDEESEKNLDEITGCTEHKKLGESSDGTYRYYLSINKDADEDLVKEIDEIKAEIIDMAEFQKISLFEKPQSENGEEVTSVGNFKTTGIDGETYTDEVFQDYDLTLVNVFATWCSPCVKEMPELEKLYQELKENGVGVVGVVVDTLNDDGSTNEDSVETAKQLQEKTGVTYPVLIPDSGMMNGRLNGINAYPETFFVDKNGKIVGDTYTGSHDLDEWKEIVEKTRNQLAENETEAESETKIEEASSESETK